MPRFKDQAICIREIDWSQTSQVVVLLTEQHGKVRGLAKGSKRTSPSSVQRYSGGVELLTLGQIVATTRPTAELATVTEWDLQNDYYTLRRELTAQRLGMYGADLAGALLADDDPHPGMFAALRDFLDAIARTEKAPDHDSAALVRYQWRVLNDCGYRPELDRDVRQGGPLKDQSAYSFDPRAGGLTQGSGPAKWRVRRQTVAVLRGAAGGAAIDRADADSLSGANRLLCVYARAILDQELPTMQFVLGKGNLS